MFNDKNENNELNINEVADTESAEEVSELSQQAEETAEETAEAETEDTAENASEEDGAVADCGENCSCCDGESKPEKKRRQLSKKTKYRATFSTIAVLFVAVVIVVNLLFGALAMRVNMNIDLTPNKLLELSDETIEILDNLDEKVAIYSLLPEDQMDVLGTVNLILERYRQYSGKIKYAKIDTVQNPEFLDKYTKNGERITEYTVIFESGSKYKVVDMNDVVSFNNSSGQMENLYAEQKFTSAIVHVTSEAAAKVGVVQGHEEIEFETFDVNILEPENYEAVSVNLLTDGVPEDIDMLIIPSPMRDFDSIEIDALDAYFDRGGKVQLILYNLKNSPNLASYLAEWGVSVYDEGYVYEQSPSNYVSFPSNIIPAINDTDVTENLVGRNNLIVYPLVRGIKVEEVNGVENTELLTSSDSSFAKMNPKTSASVKEDVDIDGPITIATMLTRFSQEGTPRFMILGGDGIFSTFSTSAYGNKDFYYNAISYMTDGGESIYIRPKDISPQYLLIPANMAVILSIVVVVVIPLLMLIAGLVIWNKRRHL